MEHVRNKYKDLMDLNSFKIILNHYILLSIYFCIGSSHFIHSIHGILAVTTHIHYSSRINSHLQSLSLIPHFRHVGGKCIVVVLF